jgi:hypothetical protein
MGEIKKFLLLNENSTYQKSVGYSEDSSKREVYSYECLH